MIKIPTSAYKSGNVKLNIEDPIPISNVEEIVIDTDNTLLVYQGKVPGTDLHRFFINSTGTAKCYFELANKFGEMYRDIIMKSEIEAKNAINTKETTIDSFIIDTCEPDIDGMVKASDLREAYIEYAGLGQESLTSVQFGKLMGKYLTNPKRNVLNIVKKRTSNYQRYVGISFK